MATDTQKGYTGSMNFTELDTEATDLIDKALAKVSEGFDEQRHRLVTAILTEEGNVHYGINLQLDKIKRASACSDSGAISNVVLHREHPKLLVAVRKPFATEPDQKIKVVNPCGLCREMLTDYYPDLEVVVSTPDGVKKCVVSELLPLKY